MDVMFFTLKETAEKLNKSEEEIKEMARQGKLREFREGPNSLFKVDEVESLLIDTLTMPSEEPTAAEEPIEMPEPMEAPEPSMTQEPVEAREPTPTMEPEPTEMLGLTDTSELGMMQEPTEVPEPSTTPEPTEAPQPEPTGMPELMDTSELELGMIQEPTEAPEPTPTPEPTETPEQIPTPGPELIEIPEPAMTQEPAEAREPSPTPEPEPIEMPELMDTSELGMIQEPTETPEPSPTPEPEPIEMPELMDTSEPVVTPEPIDTAALESELTGADTAIAGEGIDVLDKIDTGPQATDDTVIEAKDTTAETSLQEIEEDVNLDSFGSGSGLLDLSLQADDTSLGGILDEIYAPDAGEGQQVEETTGSAIEMAAEAEHMLPGEGLTATGPARAVPILAQAYVEPEPDTMSNAFGYMLILPFAAIVYTAIVAVTGFSNIMPAILEKVQGIIWPIMGGIAFLAILIVLVAYMLSGKGTKEGKKEKAKKGKTVTEVASESPEDTAA